MSPVKHIEYNRSSPSAYVSFKYLSTGELKVIDRTTLTYSGSTLSGHDVRYILNSIMDRDVHLYLGTHQKDMKRYRISDGTIQQTVTLSHGNWIEEILDMEGFNWILVVTGDTDFVAYDQSLAEVWTRELNRLMGNVTHMAWRPTTIYFSFAAASTGR